MFTVLLYKLTLIDDELKYMYVAVSNIPLMQIDDGACPGFVCVCHRPNCIPNLLYVTVL